MTERDPAPVYPIGAGPGDPELLTVKARRLIDSADVVMHDSLVGDGIVETLPTTTEVIDVGKRPDDGGCRWKQGEINRRMAQEARAGNVVARLKGGDATVFGRGGEEAEYLTDEGIPATHRDHASSRRLWSSSATWSASARRSRACSCRRSGSPNRR